MSFQAGAFYFDGRDVPEYEASSGLSHRYPGLLLTHTGSQDFAESTCAITFDGRLDNREDLLIRLGTSLGGKTSDAALALAAYERWGADGLVHLIGDWSLAIWDPAAKAILLASDFAGVRPLYYCVSGIRAMWSTRLTSLVGWTQAGEIDDEYVAGMLTHGKCPNRTPYRGIYPVPSGHSVLLSSRGVQTRRFWQLPIGNAIRYQREADYEEHLRTLFKDAVRSRLRTDAPVITELSGGLDSSSIVCMASHLDHPRMVTLSYEHQGSLDKRFYTAVEQSCGFESVHVSTGDCPLLTENHTGDGMPEFWERLHVRAAEVARSAGAHTFMTGTLGDLIMGNWWDDSGQVSGLLRRGRIGAALKESLAWSKVLRIPISWVLWRACRSQAATLTDGPYSIKSMEDSIAPQFRERLGVSEARRFFSNAWTEAPPERRKHFRGLAEALEARHLQPPEPLEHLLYTHPFAHRPLVEYMLSIPAEIVCRPAEPRRLMRRAFQDLWPAELRKRRSKDAFGGVFLDSLRPIAAALLQRPKSLQVVERGYVDPGNLTKRLERMAHSLDCNESQLKRIILLELWLRRRTPLISGGSEQLHLGICL